MSIIELLLLGIGLSMDAFAAAVCKGLGMRKLNWRQGGLVALFFGGFQGLMPLAGWFLGRQFEQYITRVDHWIAFLLLGYIGGKMIWDAFHDQEDGEEAAAFDLKELTVMAVATSIDALAVGVTFAFLSVPIFTAVSLIGVITLVLSCIGVKLGAVFGNRFQSKAELAGGLILIGMGTKILLEHTIFS